MLNQNIDYPKIIIVGVVLFLLIWGIIFGFSIFMGLNEYVVSYGSFSISMAIISIYFLISFKIRKNILTDCKSSNEVKDRRLTNREIYYALFVVVYALTGYFIYIVYSARLGKLIMLSSIVFVVLEMYLRKKLPRLLTNLNRKP